MNDAAALTDLSRRDARRRARLHVAVYAVTLVFLLFLGSYLAPAEAIDAPNGTVVTGPSTQLHSR